MRCARRLSAAVLVVLWIVLEAPGGVGARSLDDRVYDVARQLMCPVCSGQTAAESDATVAREMRAIIRRKLEAGETPRQILQYFVAQFGEGILAEPPRRGVSLLLYAGPLAALATGLALASASIRRWVRARVPGAGGGDVGGGGREDAGDPAGDARS